MLQNEMRELKTESEIEFATEQLRNTLLQMKTKREQFQMHFEYLFRCENNWMRQCRPSYIQDINYDNASRFTQNMLSYRSHKNQLKVTMFSYTNEKSLNSDLSHMMMQKSPP
jgi:hypothetical protein